MAEDSGTRWKQCHIEQMYQGTLHKPNEEMKKCVTEAQKVEQWGGYSYYV